jgi:hypothetical protein
VMDLESLENDEFITAVRKSYRPLADKAPPVLWSQMEHYSFVGRLMRRNVQSLNESERPQAYRLSFVVGQSEAQLSGLAIIDRELISKSLRTC